MDRQHIHWHVTMGWMTTPGPQATLLAQKYNASVELTYANQAVLGQLSRVHVD